MVYILSIHYPYEGSNILGAFSTSEKAEISKEKAVEEDDSGGYNEFSIEELEVDS